MTDKTSVLLNPERAVILGEDLLRTIGGRGLYSAWITGTEALHACGVEASRGHVDARLIYVGIAWKQDLRQRLGAHVHNAFWQDLAEILACRGQILFPWWFRDPEYPNRSNIVPHTPLAKLCQNQAVGWQRRNVRWIWLACDTGRRDLEAVERELVREADPLLNRAHRITQWPPAQLRGGGAAHERLRARWLWQVSWAAVVAGFDRAEEGPVRWFRQSARETGSVDDDGYPTTQRPTRATRLPSRRELERTFKHCARLASRDIRAAVTDTTADARGYPYHLAELELWWAAHAGAADVHAALAASLGLADETSFPAPDKLPAEARQRDLVRRIKRSLLCVPPGGS